MPAAPSRAVPAIFVVSAILFACPLILAFFAGAEHWGESLGVRYFASARIVDGNSANLWVPQGQLISSIQHIIYFLIDSVMALPKSDLRGRFHAFGYLTNLSVVLLNCLLLVAIYRSRVLRADDKHVLAIASAIPAVATGAAGTYYANLPDYFQLNIVIYTACAALFVRNLREHSTSGLSRRCAFLGLVAGLAVANKITLIPIAAATFLPLAQTMLREGVRSTAKAIRAAIAVAIGTFTLVQLACYGFNPYLLEAALVKTTRWLNDLPVESEIGSLLFLYLHNHSYGYIFAIFVVSLVVAGWTYLPQANKDPARTRSTVILVGLAAISLSYLWILMKKPTGTTFFEIANAHVALTAMIIAAIDRTSVRKRLAVAVGLAILAIGLFNLTWWRHDYHAMRVAKRVNEIGWSLFWKTQSTGKPVVVVVPNNEYVGSGPYEALLKGVSDSPTWNITAGRVYLDRLNSPVTYRTDGSQPKPDAPYNSNVVILWYERLDLKPALTDKYPSLREAAAERRCESIDARPTLRATVCFPKNSK